MAMVRLDLGGVGAAYGEVGPVAAFAAQHARLRSEAMTCVKWWRVRWETTDTVSPLPSRLLPL